PAGLTRVFVERAVDAVCIPMQVPAGDFDAVMAAIKRVQNVDGAVGTGPHKIAATPHRDAPPPPAAALAAGKARRRGAGGRWGGDMTDGVALLAALRAGGFEPKARRALVVGAGGAGSAVAHALAEAGARVAVHDIDRGRCDDLRQRLAAWGAAA